MGVEGCSGAPCAPAAVAGAAALLLLLGVVSRSPPGTNEGALALRGVEPGTLRLVAELSMPEEAVLRAAEGALLK